MPSSFPSPAPSFEKCGISAEDRRNNFTVTLQSVSDPIELLTPGTPQNRALEWLIEDDKLCVCPDEVLACRISPIVPKFVQRYVMAVFYFSTGG
eukprot:15329478-Ditylum_brightwellii.AAC.1